LRSDVNLAPPWRLVFRADSGVRAVTLSRHLP
jgi:hypothetical protein